MATGKLRNLVGTGLLVLVSGQSPVQAAGPLDLPDFPLYLAQSVDPNVFLEVDDSGSMDWEVMTRQHWMHCAYNFEVPGRPDVNGSWDCGWVIRPGQTNQYTLPEAWSTRIFYLFQTNDHIYVYGYTCRDWGRRGNLSLCADDEITQDWRIWSNGMNKIYYDPSVDYPPPPGYPNADFFAARSDPQPGTDGFNDVRDLSGFRYYVWIDDKGYAGDRPRRGQNDNHTLGPNGEVDLWDSHYRVVVNASEARVELVEVQHPSSNCGDLASCRLRFPAVATTVVTASGGDDGYGRSLAEMQQNIANWYQYYRRRSMATKSAIAWVVDDAPYFRYGLSVINDWGRLFVQMPPASATTADYPAHNAQMVQDLFSFNWHAHGTPLRRGLGRVGEYYRGQFGGPSPITSSCQKNFSILFTDGFWNGGSPGVGDVDGDGVSNSVADVARRYYDTDLRPDLPDEVPADAFDNNTRQHMVTFTVAFGVDGVLEDKDGDGWPDADVNGNTANWPSESGDWGSPSSGGAAENIDDLWHAAYNSRGTYVSAKSPKELVDALSEALANIADRTSSAAAVALNTGSLSAGSRVFQARFETGGWTGQLLAYDINGNTGAVSSIPAWDARDRLNDKTDAFFKNTRKLYTYGDATGREFTVAGLTPQQQDLFNVDPATGDVDGLKVERIEFLRGSREFEGALFRSRDHRLGDLIHSDPTFVGTPPFVYDFDNYAGFVRNNRNRLPVVYVGGNDGMMHAFRADNGEELFAYIPEAVLNKLPLLSMPDYKHKYFVDGPIAMGDVYVSGAWKTYLAGSLRSGGQGLYVLDVTDPTAFGANKVVLEFTDGRGSNSAYADADLGYTYSTPQIRKMSNGKWAAIIGNGYNSTDADGFQGSGNAVLFIVYLDGSGYVKLTTNTGSATHPNGLATPAAIDVDNDFVVDYIYAGDLQGNLWKFDVRAGSGWTAGGTAGVSKLFQTGGGADEPITSKPTVIQHPRGIGDGVLIWLGTGKYLEQADETVSIPSQHLYALWDKMDGSTPSNLETRTLSAGAPRQLGNYSDPDWTTVDGFKIPLSIPGERVATNPFVRNNVVFFTTLIPDENACNFGGYGWLLALDAQKGTPPQRPLFDYNGDGLIDEKDLQDAQGNPANQNAVTPNEPFAGIPSSPTFMIDDFSGVPFKFDGPPPANAPRNCGEAGPQDLVFTTDSTGGLNVTTTSAGLNVCGRRGWRQTR